MKHDPALDPDGKPSLFLTRQISGYIDADPSSRQQKALPVSVFKRLLGNTFTPDDEALGQLACGAFFFGMRSCEYLSVAGTRKTRRLRVQDVRFFRNNTEFKNKRDPLVEFSDTVSITFVFQKNKQKNITVTQPRSGKELYPVRVWTKIIQRILSYPKSSESCPVNTVLIGKSIKYITGKEMFKHLGNTVELMDGLGFGKNDVGTHSVRSSFAMALYLARRPVSTIMLLGRWSSDAFLLYIRRQVQEFSAGLSSDMINLEFFFTIPVLEETDNLDPRTRNSRSLANTISINGPNASTVHAQRPAMHVWH